MGSKRNWKTDELEFIRQNYNKIPASAIAQQLQRSLSSIQNKAHKLGLRLPLSSKVRWSKEEDRILMDSWGDGDERAIARISRRTGRTSRSVRNRAYVLGLSPATYHRRWEPEEIDLLTELLGQVPMSELHRRHQELCDKRGWSRRSRTALQVFANKRLGESWRLEDGDSFSATAIASGLRCNYHRVLKWIEDKEFRKVLKPQRFNEQAGGTRWLIKRKDLAKFLKRYPSELESTRPDLVWLVSLFD